MDPNQQLSFKDLFTHIIRDMAAAICERPNESKQHQFIRTQVATHMILGLMPRDVIEAMLAGQTVMFHALMTDSIHDTLQGQIDTMRQRSRTNIVAINKAFHMNLGKLAQYQTRPSEGSRDAAGEGGTAQPRQEPTKPARTQPAQPRQAPMPAPGRQNAAQTQPMPRPEQTTILRRPSEEQIAACRANPEAMAALDANDFERFARAMGIEQPSEVYIAAASVLNAPTR